MHGHPEANGVVNRFRHEVHDRFTDAGEYSDTLFRAPRLVGFLNGAIDEVIEGGILSVEVTENTLEDMLAVQRGGDATVFHPRDVSVDLVIVRDQVDRGETIIFEAKGLSRHRTQTFLY
jgi:hypothetical protein